MKNFCFSLAKSKAFSKRVIVLQPLRFTRVLGILFGLFQIKGGSKWKV